MMNGTSGSTQTITGLRRWSCQDKQLPEVDKIRAIHIYDFDNTRNFSPSQEYHSYVGLTAYV